LVDRKTTIPGKPKWLRENLDILVSMVLFPGEVLGAALKEKGPVFGRTLKV